MSMPSIEPAPPPVMLVESDRPCIKCSYNLRGLPITGNCPECGTPVADSLRGILLQYASAEYLTTIRSGLSLVLNGILLLIIMTVCLIFIGFLSASYGVSRSWIGFLQVINLGPTIMILFGYWRYTQPDPGFVGMERPDSARKLIRITIVVQAVMQAFSAVFVLFGVTGSLSANTGAGPIITLLEILSFFLGIANFAAWVVQFFAVMRHTRWIAERIPDTYTIKRANTYMWLLPLLETVGILALGLGPLIALVMYWNLLDRVRKHVRSIIDTSQPAKLPGMLT